jgi:ectoine hydroxylase-related dioxygenase (phytanoyl-CoA dioxygenase family)
LEKDGISRTDYSSWPTKHSIDKMFGHGDGSPWTEVFNKRIADNVNDICGADTWTNTVEMGWWMVTFPGHASSPWDHDGKYHVDGYWFQHYAFSKEIGCTLIMFFSDVAPEGGGTAVAVGSHKCIARALVEAGTRGMRPSEVAFCVDSCLSSAQYPLEELHGKAGDVIIMHPFLIHARSKNLGMY